MGNANFFAYRAWSISDNGFIVGDGITQRGFNVAYLAYPAELPTVTDVTPEDGTTSGGTTVTIQGSNFNTNTGATGFVFGASSVPYGGGQPATNVVCATTTSCTATTPAGSPGTFDVYASTGVGYSLADSPDDDFTYVEPPEIDSVDPVSGPLTGGNTVVVDGSGFDSGLDLVSVDFDPTSDTNGSQAIPVSIDDVDVVSDSEIDITAPDVTTAANGAPALYTSVKLVFEDPGSGDDYQANPVTEGDDAYDFGVPIIDSIDPEGGPLDGGNQIVINGSGFDSPNLDLADVEFDPVGDTNGSEAFTADDSDFQVVSDSEIDVTAPDATDEAAPQSTLDTDVTTVFSDSDGNEVDSVPAADDDNEYFFGAPVIESLDPGGGPLDGGNTIVVRGTGFDNPDLTLTSAVFDPTDDTDGSQEIQAGTANVDVVSDDELEITAPNVTSDADGDPTLDTNLILNYRDPSGDDVASVPQAEGDNEYVFGAPVIDSVEPGGGPLGGGNTITIRGSGFDNPDLNLESIDFYESDADESQPATLSTNDFDVVSDYEIDVTAPDASDAVSSGDASLTTEVFAHFTDENGDDVYSEPLAEGDNDYDFGAPVVDSIDPSGGPLSGGNTIQIFGSGFDNPDLNLDTVEFDPVDDTDGSQAFDADDADIQVVSDSEVDVTVPDGTAAAGSNSSLDTDVTVTYTDENGNQVDSVPAARDDSDYTFGAPVIDSVEPAGGPVDGGNTIKIIGSGFQDANLTLQAISFDPEGDTTGNEAFDADQADVTIVSDTEIDVTAPDASDEVPEGDSSLLTAVSADFTGPGGDDVDSVPATLGDNYYVFGAPVVDSIAPASGPLGGGNTIKIMGSGFEDPDLDLQGILFDPVGDTDGSEAFDANSGDVHVVSDNEIDVIAPDGTDAADGAADLDTEVTVAFSDTDGNEVDSVPGADGDNVYTYNETAAISEVGISGTGADPTIVITGSGFGSKPATVSPCVAGGEDFAHDDLTFSDLTTNTGAGAVGDCIGLDVSTYTDTEIAFTLGAGYAQYPPLGSGDQFEVDVYGATYTGTFTSPAQTVSFSNGTGGANATDSVVLPDTTYVASATGSGGGTITYSLGTGSSGCSVNSGSGAVSFSGAGTCIIDAAAGANGQYAASTTDATLTITVLLAQTVGFSNGTGGANATDSVVLPDTTYVASATGSGGGTITYSLGTGSSGCSVNSGSGAVSFSGAGTCIIDAAAGANGQYAASTTDATLTITVTVTKASQKITFAAISSKTLAASPLTVTATASSGLAVTFTTSTPAVCTAGGTNGTTITLVSAGTCTVDANQAGTSVYAAAPQVARSFTVSYASQKITFAAISSKTLAASPLTVTATASSGLAVTFTTSTPAVCTAGGTNGATITLVSAGTCTVDANQAGTSVYAAAPQVARSFTVSYASQKITFAAISSKTLAASPLTVTATASSGLAVTFTTSTPAVCTAGGTNGATITLVSAGTCTVDANQAGTSVYAAAPQVARSFTVSYASQKITFAAISSKTLAASPLTVTATASSGLAVTFTTSTPAVCTAGGTNGTTITLVSAGTCTVDANQAGTSVYAAAPQVARSFKVT